MTGKGNAPGSHAEAKTECDVTQDNNCLDNILNFGSPKTTELPLNVGFLKGIHIVIPECVLCGMKHYHGASNPRQAVGEYTTRVPHCSNIRRYGRNASVIHIISEIGPGDIIPGLSRRKKPRDGLPRPPMIECPVEKVGL